MLLGIMLNKEKCGVKKMDTLIQYLDWSKNLNDTEVAFEFYVSFQFTTGFKKKYNTIFECYMHQVSRCPQVGVHVSKDGTTKESVKILKWK